MDIGAATSLSHLTTHLLVESCHHGLSGVVLQIVAIAKRNRSTLRRTDAQHIDSHASLFGFLGSLQGSSLMVFTIGDNDNGLADFLLLGEAMRRHRNGFGDIRSLCRHHRRVDGRQEHLRRHIVAGNGQLHEGIASKDDKSYLVVGEIVDHVLYQHLRTIQTTGRHVLCQHRVTDIHTDNGLYTGSLLMTDFRAKLRTGYHDDDQGQCRQQQPELHGRTEARHVGHELAHQFLVAKAAQALLLLIDRQKADDGQQGYHR